MALFHDDRRFLRNAGKAGAFRVYKTLSSDGGLTWGEPGLIRSPDGRRMAVLLRENSRKFNSFLITSDDEGQTWSAPVELAGALTGDRHVGAYAPDGRLFVTCRDTTLESPTKGDWAGWVGRFEDIVNGRQGQYRVRLMDNTKAADCGTLVTTTYGHWSEGEQPYIVSVRLKLSDLDARAP